MKPLAGRRIVVTRRSQQSSVLIDGLRKRGATVIEAPAIEVVLPEDTADLDAALRACESYDWMAFTSANAVRFVGERLFSGRSLPPVASVGPATTLACRKHLGVEPALVPPSDFRAEGLLEAFAVRGVSGRRILLPVSDRARDTLSSGLIALGAHVDRVTAYRTVAPPGLAETLAALRRSPPDLVIFASPSAVESFGSASPDGVTGTPAAVIGPVTEQAARAAGFNVAVVAEPSTTEGLLAAIDLYFPGPARPAAV